jgi:hypothetical protein
MNTKQTQAAFTPGPWFHHVAKKRTGIFPHRIWSDVGRVEVTRLHASRGADATLIAAAPALYEAGERVIKAFEALGTPRAATNAQKDECEGALLALDAALRQARGEA